MVNWSGFQPGDGSSILPSDTKNTMKISEKYEFYVYKVNKENVMKTDILINITKDPVFSKNISWVVNESGDNIVLYEIVESYYEHPDAEGQALIPKLEMIEIERIKKNDTLNAAPLFQLRDSLNTIKLIFMNREK